MIHCGPDNVVSLLNRVAPALCPDGLYKRNDIGRHWTFGKTAWIGHEIRDAESRKVVALSLESPEFTAAQTAYIENALSLLLGQRPETWTLIDEQFWGDERFSNRYDCGYQTTYEFGRETLRITINHKGTDHHRKATAIAQFQNSGALTWKVLCELKGPRIQSRNELQYRQTTQAFGPANAHLFHEDEQELFELAVRKLTKST